MDMLKQNEASVTMLAECFLNGDCQLCLDKLTTEKETAKDIRAEWLTL